MLTAETEIGRRVTCPEPGIYHGIPAEDYFAWPAVNNSSLKHFIRSPAHYIAAMGKIEEDEEIEKNRGTVCHAGLLEPERFAREYAIGPDVDLRTKAGKAEWEAFRTTAPGKTLVRGKDADAMIGVHGAVWSHPYASKILASDGPREICLVWQHETSGLLCKCRIDKVSATFGFIADLKTTGDARTDAFYWQAEKLGYFRQAAFYLEGAAKCGLPMEEFCIIAVEDKSYHGLSVLVVEQDELTTANAEINEAMLALEMCRITGIYPGYPATPQPLKRPERKR